MTVLYVNGQVITRNIRWSLVWNI